MVIYSLLLWDKIRHAYSSGVLGTIFLGGGGGGGGSELSTNMRPYNVTLDKRGPKARAERRRFSEDSF